MLIKYLLDNKKIHINTSSLAGSFTLPAFLSVPREEYIKIMQFGTVMAKGGANLLHSNNGISKKNGRPKMIIEIGERVRITQPGVFHMKCGTIVKQLDNNDRYNWYLIKVEGLEVGLPENAFDIYEMMRN